MTTGSISQLVASSSVARAIFRHVMDRRFHRYFNVVPADSEELRAEVYRVRFDVYCTELGFEDPARFPEQLEMDEYDPFSLHSLLLHKPSGQYAGCVRLVCANPDRLDDPLPFEEHAEHLYKDVLDTAKLDRRKIGEISRLAVRSQFRRRKGEAGTATGVVPDRTEQGKDTRVPWIAMGLYLAAAATGLLIGLDGVFALMEPRLARRLGMYGLTFRQVGSAIEHRGLRAPFYITREDLLANLSLPVRALLEVIQSDLRNGRGWEPMGRHNTVQDPAVVLTQK